ncbi:MAG: hypothetical protein ACRDMZ_16545, partial [Solirubrobacteraceae bacterium]
DGVARAGEGQMRHVPLALSLALFAPFAVIPASAGAASLAVSAPAAPPSEDSGFAVIVTGSADGFRDNDAYLTAKIRPAGAACAPVPEDDSGARIDGVRSELVRGAFTITASHVLADQGSYVICAWLEEDCCLSPSLRIGPISTLMAIRPPQLLIAMAAPARVTVGQPFEVSVNYFAEVPRALSVIVARASSCSISSSALKGISSSVASVSDAVSVSGAASIRGALRIDERGTYLICGFFERSSAGVAQYAAVGPRVLVSARARLRSCGNVGGRRHITKVRARSVSCGSAKALARRWGRRPGKRVGSFACRVRSRLVTCTGVSGARVSFRLHPGR